MMLLSPGVTGTQHCAMHPSQYQGGSIAALVGVNGSGKSTLFKAIMGFVRLTSGKISVLGIPTRQALQKNRLPTSLSQKRLTGHFLYWWKMW